MATEMTLFTKDGNTLPAHLQNLELDAVTKALAGSAGGGVRISIRGGVWRMMAGNEEVSKNTDRKMNVVIVAASPHTQRTWYAGAYVEGENASPECWSSDDVTPDEKAPNPQASKCATCPQNIAGSGQGTSRACRFSRNLAVVLDNDFGGSVYKLSIPAQSLFGKAEGNDMPLQAYAKQLAAHRINLTAVVTEMEFDTNSATPKIFFRAVRPLTAEEYAQCTEQGQTYEAQEAIKHDFFIKEESDAKASVEAKPVQAVAMAKPAVKTSAPKAPAPKPAPASVAEDVVEVVEVTEVVEVAVVRKDAKPAVSAPKSAADVMAAWDDE